uniref:Uncharacterized protein n=1 Tax=mine drainage metagenome TaxID=410659 RepID=E6Q2W2_9ZZZZ
MGRRAHAGFSTPSSSIETPVLLSATPSLAKLAMGDAFKRVLSTRIRYVSPGMHKHS